MLFVHREDRLLEGDATRVRPKLTPIISGSRLSPDSHARRACTRSVSFPLFCSIATRTRSGDIERSHGKQTRDRPRRQTNSTRTRSLVLPHSQHRSTREEPRCPLPTHSYRENSFRVTISRKLALSSCSRTGLLLTSISRNL